jgi:hypothetical protein
LEASQYSCEKLVRTGFKHPQTTADGIAEMAAWYNGRTAERGEQRSEFRGRNVGGGSAMGLGRKRSTK